MNQINALSELEKNGFVVWDDFLNHEELQLIVKDYLSLRDSGKFKRAGIGKGSDFHLNDEVRQDETYWLEPLSLSSAQKILWEKLETLKLTINESFFLGLWDFEAHYSYYPVGGIYQAHLDRFSKDDARTMSMVLYLNDSWEPSDGGELRIYPKDKNLTPIDISPLGGRLVCFFSADILHEVLPAKKPRFGFAGWWKRR